MPVFSVIVPIYNVEPYLRRCVNSILHQTFQDFELILVDDGSPDGCGRICEEYALQDSRVRVIHKENGGVSSARNMGLDMASGKYVFFLDSDDYVDTDFLERVLPYMENGADMTAFQLRFFWDDGRDYIIRWKTHGTFFLDSQEKRFQFVAQKLLTYFCGWEVCTRIFVREKIEQYGLRFADNRRVFAEDLFFTLCYCAHVEKAEILDYTPYHYQQRDDSTMADQREKVNIHRYNELSKEAFHFFQKWTDCDYFIDHHAMIHYLLVTDHLLNEYELSGLPASRFRALVRERMEDWSFFEQQLRTYLRHERSLKLGLTKLQHYKQISHIRYLLGGSRAGLFLRLKLLNQFEKRLEKEVC